MGMNKTRFDTITVILIALIAALSLGLFMIHQFILPIVLGVMLSIILRPIYLFLRLKGLGAKTTSLLMMIALVLIVVGPVTFFVARAINQGVELATSLSQNQQLNLNTLAEKFFQWEPAHFIASGPEDLVTQIQHAFDVIKNSLGSAALVKIGGVPGLVLQAFILILTTFFLLIDGDKIILWFKKIIPLEDSLQKKLSSSMKRTTVSSFWATMTAAMSQTLVMGFGFLILGLPSVVLAMGATFIFAWIPFVGCGPVWISGVIYLYFQKMFVKMIVLAAIGMFTGVIDNIVRSWVLRGRDNMHPAVALVSIFGGISFFGISGVFIGPVIASLIISLLEIWTDLIQLKE